jgi:predicted permease
MRIYRAILHAYPSAFRREYGGEMAADLQARLRQAHGPLDRGGVWAAAIADVLAGAARMHADVLGQDLRYTARTLRRSPAFTLTVLIVTALGIGANTAAFSVTDFVLLRPLEYPRADRLVALWQRTPGYPRLEPSPANYRDWKRSTRSFKSMGAVWSGVSANLVLPGADPERLTGAAVTWDLLPTLGVPPALGRSFTETEDRDGAPGTLLLSDALWRSLFGGRADAIGRTLMLDGQPFTVIGVMPPGFAFPSRQTEFWRPLQFWTSDTDRTNTFLHVVGRLNDGATLAGARTEMDGIAARLAAQFPKENGDMRAALLPLRDEVPRQSRLLALALSGAALCVLLIVCANLANLFLTRALSRRQELAVRAAIGAGRERLVRQLATEAALPAAIGGVLGVLLAYLAVPALAQLAPANLPTAAVPDVNTRVLLFAALLTAVTALAFGIAPALRLGRDVDANGLREGARSGARRARLRSALVIAELAISIVLLVSAGLLLQALATIGRVDPGFKSDGVLTMRTILAWPQYAPTEKRAAFYQRVLGDVRALPGVADAAYISGLPMVVRGAVWSIALKGDPGGLTEGRSVSLRYVTPGFFRTLGIPLKQGRDVEDGDGPKSPFVAVVSESLARRQWPGQDPIGQRFTVAFFERTIVGVAADVRMRGLEAPGEPQVYIPYRQIPDGYMIPYAPKDLAIRTSLPPAQIVPAVRAIVQRADPQEPISDVRLLGDIVAAETGPRTEQLRVLGAFAFVAALLAAVGIHGLLAFGVSQRVQEFGVRMAIGARPFDVASLVLAQAARLAVAGVVPGLLLAYAAGRSLQALLAGVSPGDPATFAAVAAVAVLMTVAGSVAPAWRAQRVNPIDALRADV